MNYSEFTWKQEGETFFSRAWTPTSINAMVCIIPGFGEHSGRYKDMAEYLTIHGFGVTAMDTFGHGKSTGRRGYSPSYESSMNSIQRFLEETERFFPGHKTFLYGHSMGGGLAINFVLRRRPKLTGLILGSPLFKIAFIPPFIKIFLARIMNKIYPSFSNDSNLDTTTLSRDHEIVKAYLNDPLVHGKISARTFLELMDSGQWALQHANELNIHCLLMHGTSDRITSYKASEEFVSKAPQALITFKSWEGFYHELHNEPEPYITAVLEWVVDWMKKLL